MTAATQIPSICNYKGTGAVRLLLHAMSPVNPHKNWAPLTCGSKATATFQVIHCLA